MFRYISALLLSLDILATDQRGLYVAGTIRKNLSHGDTCVTEDIYNEKGLKEPLPGRPTIDKIDLVVRTNDIQS